MKKTTLVALVLLCVLVGFLLCAPFAQFFVQKDCGGVLSSQTGTYEYFKHCSFYPGVFQNILDLTKRGESGVLLTAFFCKEKFIDVATCDIWVYVENEQEIFKLPVICTNDKDIPQSEQCQFNFPKEIK